MKAVVIKQPGGVEALEIQEVETPTPTADRVRVRVRATALNRADILQRMGKYPAPPSAPADIPGLEFAGEVEQLGPEVREWKVGDRVFGICGGGAHAEFVNVPANHLAAIPLNLDWEQAAAVPEVFITAHDALFTQANLEPGERVLIHAVGSGVGTAAVQLVDAAGATSVGVSRTADKLERATELGLTQGVVARDAAEVSEAVKGLLGESGIDVVLDLVGAAYFEANVRLMSRRGRMILVGTTSGSKATLDYGQMMSKRSA